MRKLTYIVPKNYLDSQISVLDIQAILVLITYILLEFAKTVMNFSNSHLNIIIDKNLNM